ncbi:Dickkopf-related protein 1 [Nibea albiflora]|uniref:Dickkopf-related protein 1 n=1 Tax=Nibea albiflora TaxID=240163 RepID=A0ACB7EDA0_NIBAL|nr:Dickkopf-related protein 1 [Nibea albiflora]
MQMPSAHRFLAVYLTLFGYLGDVYTGTVLMNSNAIKNLPGASGSKGSDTVSPSPRTSPSGSVGHKLPVDTLQVSARQTDIDGTDASITTGSHKNNNTMQHQAKKSPTAHGHQPHAVKGQEGDTCLRSADCSEGLCCARHFWSRICKPVLTEGQVCTRHRRKGTHGLELFQRCDCGDGMTCRPEKGEQDHSVSRTAARNLHTCQRR